MIGCFEHGMVWHTVLSWWLPQHASRVTPCALCVVVGMLVPLDRGVPCGYAGGFRAPCPSREPISVARFLCCSAYPRGVGSRAASFTVVCALVCLRLYWPIGMVCSGAWVASPGHLVCVKPAKALMTDVCSCDINEVFVAERTHSHTPVPF